MTSTTRWMPERPARSWGRAASLLPSPRSPIWCHAVSVRTVSALAVLAIAVLVAPAGAAAESVPAPYAGQHTRAIKSLSADDIRQIQEGQGWELAKAAELNGLPGPAHLLELRSELGLSDGQIAGVQAIFDRMRADARRVGARLLDLEMQLDHAFRDRRIEASGLRTLVDAIGTARAELRFIHLAAHLETPEILSDVQIARYGDLRGYDSDGGHPGDPKHGH